MSATIPYKGDFIDGQFVDIVEGDAEWAISSPADLKETVFQAKAKYDNLEKAVEAANRAYKTWKVTPQAQRNEYLMKLHDLYVANKERMAEAISRETGKPLWESLTEAGALAGKIKITLEHSMKLIEDVKVENALPSIDGYIRHQSRGVMAVLGPFNFPCHLANGHIVPAVATGNTIVFKPSEKTPATGQLMAEMIEQAGFPKGVFNLVQGQGETGKRLAGHEYVDGVLFTGSYDVGLKIKQETLQHHWKILALEMGGKNASVIWDDCDFEKATYETLVGAFLTSGQRCSGTSRVILKRGMKEKFLDRFYKAAKKIEIGHWKDNPFMGPLISEDSVEKYVRFQEIALREGAEKVMRGKPLELATPGHYVTPSIYDVKQFNPKSVYQKSEIFGPNVAIYTVDEIEEALEINNSTGFGLVMSIFTKDEALYKKALMEAKVGLLNWNRTTNGASSRMPFGGRGKSGNDRPSAHFAVNYCTVPVASLEDHTELDTSKLMPGIDF